MKKVMWVFFEHFFFSVERYYVHDWGMGKNV